MKKATLKSMSLAGFLALLCAGCGSSTNVSSGPSVFVLNVTSVNPTAGVLITASPLDNNGAGAAASTGATAGTYPESGLDYVYNKGTVVTLTAAAQEAGNAFFGWTGCDSTSGLTCTVTMTGPKAVQAQYPGVTSLVITPINPTAGVPSTTQFTVTESGIGMCTYQPPSTNPMAPPPPPVTVACSQAPYTYSLSSTGLTAPYTSAGTIDQTTGIYTTPFPAPATVTVTVTSQVSQSVNAQTTITLDPTIATPGPVLSVDLGSPTHAISPYIYGMNDYDIPPTLPALVDLPIERWGGDMTTRYNYTNDSYNSASDYYFENNDLGTGLNLPDTSTINTQLTTDLATNTKSLVTVPLVGYTTLRTTACSFSVAKYGKQTAVAPNNPDCGNGVSSSSGNDITGNNPDDTSYSIDQTFDSGWVQFLAGKYGTAANGGVAIYALDNEPEYWSAVHRDVHPAYMSYDELTNKGLTYAAAIKAQDPTALVTGPVISSWVQYFLSTLDQFQGYTVSPYCEFDNPTDYKAHGSIPLIEYYLQQFAANEQTTGTRLLDYLDMHTYFAPNGVDFSTAGSALLQAERLDSTRVFWDPTYVDLSGNYPNVFFNSATNYDPCTGPVQLPPMLIPRAKGWVTKDYPGTKVAFTEYNWGGLESINGALAQADILGIFGREGLDMAMIWAPPTPVATATSPSQYPGVAAFQMYTNYDGKGSKFGDMALTSTSTIGSADGEGYLAVYGAQRSSDKAITVMVINKGAADQNTTLSLLNTTASGNATSYQFLSTNLTAITAGPTFAITAPASGSTTSTITGTFPAQSITLLIIPQ